MKDVEILSGLSGGHKQRALYEKKLYQLYEHFIKDGCRKFGLSYEDSFSAYSDALLSVIHNVVNKSFGNKCSLKTYLFQVYSHKCIDIFRKRNTAREKMHQPVAATEFLQHLPDTARDIVEELTDKQQVREIKNYLETIGEKNKEILLLYGDGYTDEQIAGILEYKTKEVVKTTRLRCIKKIMEKLKAPSLAAS